MDIFTLLLLAIVAIWIGVGYLLFALGTKIPKPGVQSLIRTTSQKVCLVGDRINVTLTCSAVGWPEVQRDENATPWDVVLVIDHSGSMGSGTGSALEEAKQAAVNLARTTPSNFRYAVVEFDHEARELCPLTSRRRRLFRSLKSIKGGGSTDIALGLNVAAYSLRKTDSLGERRQAVLLLSDGCSERFSAVEAADKLKHEYEDLLLITIGIGYADMGLLSELATSPDHCYRADQIDELTELYSEIGRMLGDKQIHEVQTNERFNHTGPWGIRAWGELIPVQRKIQEGRLSWLLATVEQRPTELTYVLEALCPGWHRVALEPAYMKGMLPDKSSHETKSNRGPRVLVMPRIPGWQLLWLLLNPLFFILFRRMFCRRQTTGPLERPKVPHKKELNLPPPLQVPPSRERTLPLRPSLIIGLGYGGSHTLIHAKRLLWERGPRADFNKLRFLLIDTAGDEFFPTSKAGPILLDDDERLNLDKKIEPLLRQEAVALRPNYPWLSAFKLAAGGCVPISCGAPEIRGFWDVLLLSKIDSE